MEIGLKTLKKLNIRVGQVFILLAVLTGWSFAQTVVIAPTPKPKPKVAPKVECEDCPVKPSTKKTSTSSTNQQFPQTPKFENYWDWEFESTPQDSKGDKGKRSNNYSDTPFEKAIEVDNSVNVSLCISEGNVRINGWDRDEIRVFVKGGTKAGFRTRGKNEDGHPTSVTILGYDSVKDKGSNLSQCLAGDEIELDLPKGANIGQLNGPEGEVFLSVESLAKVRININQGDIQIRNIDEGISARTNEGDINVQDSFGIIDLSSTNGNIFVYNVDPLEDSDILKVRTNNGTLTLQSANHLQVDVNTISGSIQFSGQIQAEGQYSFKNTSGDIVLNIAKETSCTMTVISGRSRFSSELPFTVNNETIFPPSMKKLIATMGDGEANLSLQTQSGIIKIRKQN